MSEIYRWTAVNVEQLKQEYVTLLAQYHRYFEHNELGLTLDTLEELGHLIPAAEDFGGTWRGQRKT